ncbi:MAG: hypothetical protein IPO15_03045 [Anaerolineae bacterium]|uniref:hypothetical protein n=1 Tax=Candidatus Amarolinea dominans TaxID=3140696 RepID=UPI003135E834|nr:hypothetical protein [Anaerolineae bacterium]
MLLEEPERWGPIWLIQDGETVVGYTILTWGFTVELGGPFLLIDELYLRPSHRLGLGQHNARFHPATGKRFHRGVALAQSGTPQRPGPCAVRA